MFERLPEQMAASIQVEPAADCWLWRGKTNSAGYGYLSMPGKWVMAHRATYEFLVGPIPEGMELDHLCRVRGCVNPQHLEPVTRRENNLRGMSPAARAAKQTHCIHGHPFTQENTYLWHGERKCRACRRRRAAELRRRRQSSQLTSRPQADYDDTPTDEGEHA